MIILITAIVFVLLLVAICKDWDGEIGGFFGGAFLIGLVLTAIFGGLIINGRTLNAKIAMHEEENQRIETELNVLVEQYMNYEANTYGDLKGESSITLVSLYPELKADALVEKQIEIYTNNNSKIRGLKEKLINISNYKWWLYFGK